MKDIKVGEWGYDEQTKDVFLVCSIEVAPIGRSDLGELSYIDFYHSAHITYHCRHATQDEIDVEIKDMLLYEPTRE